MVAMHLAFDSMRVELQSVINKNNCFEKDRKIYQKGVELLTNHGLTLEFISYKIKA